MRPGLGFCWAKGYVAAGWAFLLLFAPVCMNAQPEARARLDSTNILIGDQVRLKVEVIFPPELRIRQVGMEAILENENLELLSMKTGDTITAGDDLLLDLEGTITSFDSGFHRIPPIPVVFEKDGRLDTVFSNDLGLNVRTLLVAQDTTQLQPIKDIIREPLALEDVLPWLLGGAGVAALAGLVFWWIRRIKKEEVDVELPPPPPPHQLAQTRLKELDESGLLDKKSFLEYHSRLNYILRAYLEDGFGIPALESTTASVLRKLKMHPELKDWEDRMTEMLNTVDLVKFAKAEPPMEFHLESRQLVGELVETTRPVAEEQETENPPT